MKLPALGRVRGFKGMANAYRRVRSRLIGGGMVLLYHRVVDLADDPFALYVSPQHFAEQLDVLRQTTTLLPLDEMAALSQEGRLPPRAVAITFDDGYADNLYQAVPLLEQYQVPATVFVVTGFMGSHGEFWWDQLDRLILSPMSLPPSLEVSICGRPFQWDSGKKGVTLGTRRRLLRLLHTRMRTLPEQERRPILEQLARWVGVDLSGRAEYRPLSQEEVSQLDRSSYVQVGSHTVSHPVLAELPLEHQKAELRDSKRFLEELLGRSVSGLSYPYGFIGDYTSRTLALARQAGYTYACTSIDDLLRGKSDPFQVPRVWAQNWDGETFSRWLSSWLPRAAR